MTTQALTRTNGLIQQSRDMGFDETRQLAEMCAESGFFQDTRQAAQAMVKILAGRELGFGPIASMNGIYIVKGRVSMSANLIAAAIKASGIYDYRVVQHDEQACEIHFFQRGDKVGESRFTIQEARKAGTQNLDKFARNMLFARALTNGARWHTPDVFNGPVYTPEELGARVNGEGDVIDVEGHTVNAVTGEIVEERPRTQVQPRKASDPDPQAAKVERLDGELIHPKTVDPATQRETTILRGEENPHYAPRTTDEEAAHAAALKKGIGDHKGWMVNRKMDPENKALSLWLLNCAMYDVAEGQHTFWTSRKDLTGEQWTACNGYLSKMKPSELQKIVQEFYASIEAEEAGAVETDPFADEAPTALLDVPVTAGTHHGQS